MVHQINLVVGEIFKESDAYKKHQKMQYALLVFFIHQRILQAYYGTNKCRVINKLFLLSPQLRHDGIVSTFAFILY